MTTEREKLKLCPFCGRIPKYVKYETGNIESHDVSCMAEDCINPQSYETATVGNADSSTYAMGAVIAAWNARATTPSEAEVRAELIVPCPYASVNPNDNQGINFFVKSYPEYYDIVELQNNRPARCIRVALQPFNTGRE